MQNTSVPIEAWKCYFPNDRPTNRRTDMRTHREVTLLIKQECAYSILFSQMVQCCMVPMVSRVSQPRSIHSNINAMRKKINYRKINRFEQKVLSFNCRGHIAQIVFIAGLILINILAIILYQDFLQNLIKLKEPLS